MSERLVTAHDDDPLQVKADKECVNYVTRALPVTVLYISAQLLHSAPFEDGVLSTVIR